MLRKISLIVAVAAILAIPVSEADARRGHGLRIGHVGHGHGLRLGHVGVRHFHRGAFLGHRRVFFGHHFRRHPRFFVGVGLYASCWRLLPTVYGWRRVWVCGPHPYYPYY
jgi:hypothetical protein